MTRSLLSSFEDRCIDGLGNTILTPEQFTRACLQGRVINNQVFVTEISQDIRQYNRYASQKVQLYNDTLELQPASYDWNIPEYYQTINVSIYVANILSEVIDSDNWSSDEIDARVQRVAHELTLVKKHNLINLFRCLIYIIDTLTEKKAVWGVGRGSSVASYLLYLIGVHDVDSVLYDIDPLEFYKTE